MIPDVCKMVHMDSPRFFTAEEVAERYDLRPEQVRILRRKGRLTAINVATGTQRKIWRYSEADLQTFERTSAA